MNMIKILTLVAIMLLTVAGLNAYNLKTSKQEENKSESKNEVMSMKGKKILVAYFSWSGNTKYAAQYIAKKMGADMFEIVRKKPYSKEYQLCTEEAKAEKEANERPAIKGKVDNIAQYDVIFIGVPVWWYTAPMPLFTFLEQYDLKGKIVIPFCTAYSGPSSTLKDIVKATPNSEHRDGICLITKEMGGKGMEKQNAKIDKWLGSINF